MAPLDAGAIQKMFIEVVESGFRCAYCGIEFEWGDRMLHPTIDHRIPISRGGNNGISNLVFCCWRCNRLKHDLTDGEYIYLVSMVEDRYKTSWVHNERFSREINRLKKELPEYMPKEESRALLDVIKGRIFYLGYSKGLEEFTPMQVLMELKGTDVPDGLTTEIIEQLIDENIDTIKFCSKPITKSGDKYMPKEE